MEMETYVRFVLALVFVLALIGLLAWVARRYGFGGRPRGGNGRGRRLDIIETRTVDGKRRLVLLRRDDVEHLVLTGPNSEIVIERGITRPSSVTAATGTSTGASIGPGDMSVIPPPDPVEDTGRTNGRRASKDGRGASSFKQEIAKTIAKPKSRRPTKA